MFSKGNNFRIHSIGEVKYWSTVDLMGSKLGLPVYRDRNEQACCVAHTVLKEIRYR